MNMDAKTINRGKTIVTDTVVNGNDVRITFERIFIHPYWGYQIVSIEDSEGIEYNDAYDVGRLN